MNEHHHRDEEEEVDLFEAISMIENKDEAKRFFMDLCTPQEIKAFNERYQVCKLLYSKKLSYREISKMTGASTTTISRVARFLNDEPYKGYKSILDKMDKENKNAEENYSSNNHRCDNDDSISKQKYVL
jgi:TrpR-related protein YerC/YecD